MKELLKLIPVLGLTTLMSLALGCTAEPVGDDTPPDEEEPYDGGTNSEPAEAGTE